MSTSRLYVQQTSHKQSRSTELPQDQIAGYSIWSLCLN